MSAIDFPDTENDQGPVGQAAAPRSLIAIWLVALGLVLLLVPLSSLGGLFEQDNAGLANQVAAAQTLAAMTPTLAPTEQAAQQRAAHLEQAINVVAPAQSTLAASSNDVPGIVKVIGGYDANELALTSLTQTDNRLVITGRASNASAVMAYARTLKNSGQFSRVVVQSISSASTPFVPPHSEADASQTPQPIFLGQPLKLTFNPDQHKDVVTFLAKANRFYEVSTTGLAPGVDTVVTVTVKGAAYTNDDSKPGTLASALTFKAPVQDTEATIEVTNRGSFGSDKTYQLQVKEFVPTPAPGQSTSIVHSSGLINPTVAPTPTPQATATEMPASTPTSNPPVVPSPTSTVAPTATPTLTATQTSTPTPDLRDAYEPDDATPTAIGVGQTQLILKYGSIENSR